MASLVTAGSRLVAWTGISRSFATFLGGMAVSKLGDAIYLFALPWIAYEVTASPLVMSTLYATEILPILLFGALAGVFVDRWDRRRLMLWSDATRAVIVASIPLLEVLGMLQTWHLYVAAFALALVSLAFDVATTAVIPEIAQGDLTRANALFQMVNQGAAMAGPALAGLVIAVLGGFNALWIDALSFGGTFLAILAMPRFQHQAQGLTAGGVLRGVTDGFQWLWQSPVIRALSLQAMIGNFGFGMVSAVLMYYLRSTLGLSAELAGLDYAMLGVGGLVGSLLIVPLARRFPKRTLYPLILLTGLSGLLLMAVLKSWWAPGLGFGLVAACNIAWVVLSTSVRQELIPPHLMGRVLAFSRMLSTAAMPVGATLGGLLSKQINPVYIFLIAAATKAVEVLIARLSAMRTLA